MSSLSFHGAGHSSQEFPTAPERVAFTPETRAAAVAVTLQHMESAHNQISFALRAVEAHPNVREPLLKEVIPDHVRSALQTA